MFSMKTTPEELAYSPAKPLVIDRPHFRLPIQLRLLPIAAGVALGVLSSALESAGEALGSKVSSFSGQTLRDQAPTQELIANGNAALRAARAGLSEALDAVWGLASHCSKVHFNRNMLIFRRN